jgi:hypothetical protein
MDLALDGDSRSMAGRVAALNLADCRLLQLRVIEPGPGGGQRVATSLLVVTGENADEYRPATLTFERCAALRMAVDFWVKHACGDTIEDFTVRSDRDAVLGVLHDSSPVRERSQPASSLYAFTLALCSPSGDVLVVAEDFSVSYD